MRPYPPGLWRGNQNRPVRTTLIPGRACGSTDPALLAITGLQARGVLSNYVTPNDVSSQLQRHYQLSAVCEQDSSVPCLLTPAVQPRDPAPRDTVITSTALLAPHGLINRDCVTHLALALMTPSWGHLSQPRPGVVLSVLILCGILCHHPVNCSALGSPFRWVALTFAGIHQTAAVDDFQVRGRPQRPRLGLLMACYLRCASGITPASWLADKQTR